MITQLENRIAGVVHWMEEHDYRAYEPGDGNLSFLRAFTFENLALQCLHTAVVMRIPFNIRPILGIRPHRSTKGTGYMAWGYLKMSALTGDESYRRRAVACLDWLTENRSPGFPQHCWGNHFDFCTRGGKSNAFSPIMPWTALIGQACLEAYQTLGDRRYLGVAASVGEGILAVPRERASSGPCLSYVPNRQSSIHNANMRGATLLAEVGKLTGNGQPLSVVKSAVAHTVQALKVGHCHLWLVCTLLWQFQRDTVVRALAGDSRVGWFSAARSDAPSEGLFPVDHQDRGSHRLSWEFCLER
jgi:uncharacterized protein YyaL (SSP411 family)